MGNCQNKRSITTSVANPTKFSKLNFQNYSQIQFSDNKTGLYTVNSQQNNHSRPTDQEQQDYGIDKIGLDRKKTDDTNPGDEHQYSQAQIQGGNCSQEHCYQALRNNVMNPVEFTKEITKIKRENKKTENKDSHYPRGEKHNKNTKVSSITHKSSLFQIQVSSENDF